MNLRRPFDTPLYPFPSLDPMEKEVQPQKKPKVKSPRNSRKTFSVKGSRKSGAKKYNLNHNKKRKLLAIKKRQEKLMKNN